MKVGKCLEAKNDYIESKNPEKNVGLWVRILQLQAFNSFSVYGSETNSAINFAGRYS